MQDIRFMKVLHSTNQVVDDMLNMCHFKVATRFDKFLQVTLRVFHHHVQSAECVRVPRVDQLDEIDH